MFVSGSVRLSNAYIVSVKIIRGCACYALKQSVVLSPKLNLRPAQGICVRLFGQHSQRFVPPDVCDDHSEKEDSKYLYMKVPRQENVNRLMECTGCDESLALSMLKDFPRLRYLSTNDIHKRIKFLSDRGVQTENILKNYWLLPMTIETLEKYMATLAVLGVSDINLAIPLLQIPLEELKKTSNWSRRRDTLKKSKISILSERMKCDPADVALAVSVHKFLRSVRFERMMEILDILLGEGVPGSKILKDMWVFRYRVELIERRVKYAKEGGIEQFKTWMVRCTEKILNNTIRIQSEKRALLGPHNDSTINYISSRLNVEPDEAQLILIRHPQLRGVGAAKLSNTLDFLLGEEEKDLQERTHDEKVGAKFKPLQIWSSSRILCHSLETTRARVARLRALGFEPENLAILYKSKRKFDEFVLRLEKQAEKPKEMSNLGLGVEETGQDSKLDVNR